MDAPARPAIARFGNFELHLKTGELRKSGIRIRLSEQPFQILAMLVEKPGEVVSRDELRQKLWSDDTFVDFERGLNRAVNKLRDALCDSAGVPRFIETVPRRGYRFLVPVDNRDETGSHMEAAPRSIAILPFTNESGMSDGDYLGDGIAESLIYRFAELPSLRVMARITAFRYRNREIDAQMVGRELSVDLVLTGRLMVRGQTLVISSELVDVHDGSLVWGQQYSRPVADLFAIQDEMSRAIFDKLRLTLTKNQLDRVQRRQTSSLEAHHLYLRGVYNWNKRELTAVRKAVECFHQAQEVDPSYALAHSGVADCFAVLSIFPYCFIPPAEAMPRAKAAAERALELDSDLAEAHTTLGLVSLVYERNFAESDVRFRRAQELKPSYSTAHLWNCLHCIATGRLEEAHEEARKTRDLDPLSPIGSTLPAIAAYYDRQYDRSVEQLATVATLEPSYPMVHLFTGYAECAVGHPERAIEAFSKALQLSPGGAPNLVALSRLGYAYGRAGKRDKAAEILQQLDDAARSQWIPAHARMFVYLGLEELDKALDGLDEMLREHSDYLIYINPHGAFDPLRKEPRFAAIVREVYGSLSVAAAASASGTKRSTKK
jgi:TolB-like protein/Flp pilus assembly protein TadD